MKKGAIIITLIAAGIAAGFTGWIMSEAAGTKTIHAANNWLVIMWIGWASTLVGFAWLWATSSSK